MSRRWVFLLSALAVTACGGSRSSGTQSPDAQPISGTERFGWDQPAADAGELATFRYALYVDSTRSEVTDVACSGPPSAAGFACTCRLPAMSSGRHTLQIAAFVLDAGTIRESARSTSLDVVVR
jgi:hypothetical protein